MRLDISRKYSRKYADRRNEAPERERKKRKRSEVDKKEIVRFVDCIDLPNRRISKNFGEEEREREEWKRRDGAITGESGPDENKNRV